MDDLYKYAEYLETIVLNNIIRNITEEEHVTSFISQNIEKRSSSPLRGKRIILPLQSTVEPEDWDYYKWCINLEHPNYSPKFRGIGIRPKGIISGHFLEVTNNSHELDLDSIEISSSNEETEDSEENSDLLNKSVRNDNSSNRICRKNQLRSKYLLPMEKDTRKEFSTQGNSVFYPTCLKHIKNITI